MSFHPFSHSQFTIRFTVIRSIGDDPFMFHAQIFKLGFDFHRFVCNDLISAFGCSGFMKSV